MFAPVTDILLPFVALLNYLPSYLIFLCIAFSLLAKPSRFQIILIIVVSMLNIYLVLDFSIASTNPEPQSNSYKIATFNTASGNVHPKQLVLWFQAAQLDALLLQETEKTALYQHLPQELQLDCHSNLCLLTKHSFTVVRDLSRRPLGGWGHYAVHYKLQLPTREIDLVNLHLETPRHSLQLLLNPIRNYQGALNRYKEQEFESMIASKLIEPSAESVIIGGDFNLTQRSRIYREYWSGWTNSFQAAGNGFGYTKQGMLRSRIDHLLSGKAIRPLNIQVAPAMGSDHHPVILTFSII